MDGQQRRTLSGAELRAVRLTLGLTQRDVAARLGISQPRVCDLEQTERPKPDTVARYLEAVRR